MGTQDISRNIFDRSKHYSSVRQQQGKVLTDDDWNENNRIHEELERRSIVDIVGAAASPDDGFLISNPQLLADRIDFTIHAGRFYLGGKQLLLERDQTFQLQTDWLQGPNPTDRSAVPSVDFVVLETCDQVVSAVEDSELFEVALGGTDTTTRLRTLQRVHAIQDIGSNDCVAAWNTFVASLAGQGTLNGDNALVPDAAMNVAFVADGNNGDLCKPNPAGGYLGAENQTIRVQLRNNNTFTWGFDNAAPLYRVQLDATRTVLTLDTPPNDQYHWPQADQTVEVLAWSAVLDNNEKLAEHQGFLTKVAAGYNPNTREITLTDPVPTSGFDDWQNRADQAAVANNDTHFYLRVWNRGSDQASPSAIPCNVGNPVDLGVTGIQVTFSGTQLNRGDYWLISARPSAPTEIMPWSLSLPAGKAPVGRTKYYAPLALIEWSDNLKGRVRVIDCRNRFKPLTQHKCCIELVAMPGAGWERIFDRVPDNGDAVICFPPGDYPISRTVNVTNKGRLRLLGAGKSTRFIGTSLDRSLLFSNCDRVEVTQLYVNGGNQHGRGIRGVVSFNNVNHVDVRHCYIRSRAGRQRDIACLRVDNGFASASNPQGRVKILDCEFYVGHLQTGVLIVNAGYVEVSRNLLLPSGPEVEHIRGQLKNKFFTSDLARLSILPRSNVEQSVPANQFIEFDAEDGTPLGFLTDPALMPFWEERRQSISVRRINGNDHALLHQRLIDEVHAVLSRPERLQQQKNLMNWVSTLRVGAAALMNQGIVVGGRRAVKVNIRDNEIRGATQGVHVGLSRQTANRTRDGADIANSVTIRNNHITTAIGAGSRTERHGCFVGNAQQVQILNNTFELQRQAGMRHTMVEAIRVFGFFGPMVRVVGNCADTAFSDTANIEQRGPSKTSWVIVDRENFPG